MVATFVGYAIFMFLNYILCCSIVDLHVVLLSGV